jgi:multidrug efflux system outer membrane protein
MNRKSFPTMRRLARISLSLLVAGCSTAPAYQRPPVELPAAWQQSAPRYALDGQWWRIYGDPSLDALVAEALKGNADLLVAAARVDEARALLGETRAAQKPVLDARAGATRQHNSNETAFSQPGAPREYGNYRATLNVSYEVDVWGRLSAGTSAARAELAASEASREAVRIALAAQVTKSYFSLRSLDEQAELTRQTVALREESLELQRKRFEAGVISQFDLRQLEAETAVVRAQLPPLRRERERETIALSVLLGRSASDVFRTEIVLNDKRPELLAPVLPAGMPSELLLRRPDLVEAERRLAAANARVAVARTEVFPSLSLTGAAGYESAQFVNLFTGPAGLWSIGAAITQPIFAGGRFEARTAAAEARERAALAQYLQAIRAAFGEVRTALAVQAHSLESFEAESKREAALAESLRLARLRYASGVSSQLDVIDAERGLLSARIARIEALRAHRAAIADLFRALGG